MSNVSKVQQAIHTVSDICMLQYAAMINSSSQPQLAERGDNEFSVNLRLANCHLLSLFCKETLDERQKH